MTHTTHEINHDREQQILSLLFDQGRDHNCINCALTSWINVGAALIGVLPRAEHHSIVTKATRELVSLLAVTDAAL